MYSRDTSFVKTSASGYRRFVVLKTYDTVPVFHTVPGADTIRYEVVAIVVATTQSAVTDKALPGTSI